MNKTNLLYIIETIAFIGLFILAISGCSLLSNHTPNQPDVSIPNFTSVTWVNIKESVKSVSWITQLSILGIGLSVFALVNGMKIGIAGIVSCVACLFMGQAVVRYGNIMAITGLIGASLLCIASILRKNTALFEIIKGVQEVKDKNHAIIEDEQPVLNRVGVNNTLRSKQSKVTRKLVEQIKTNIKLKGE
jgi:hypothetical protein